MKNLFLALGLVLSLSANSQDVVIQRTLGIEEAVLKAREYYPKSIPALQWVQGTSSYSYTEDNQLMLSDIDGNSELIFSLSDFPSEMEMKAFPRIKWINENTFEFQSGAKVYRADLEKKETVLYFSYLDQLANVDRHMNSKSYAFTRDNNLFISKAGEEVQISDNPEGVISGQAIARYEFGISKGTFWSENGEKLAFYQKDENEVGEYALLDYNSSPAATTMIRYPMAGTAGEKASVGVYDVEKGTTTYLKVNNSEFNDSYFVSNLSWSEDDEMIYLAVLNREQNHYRLESYDPISGDRIAVVYEEKDDRYAEPEHAAINLNKGQFLWFSEKDGFNNLYRFDAKGKELIHSKANFPITEFLGFDKDSRYAYVMATGENATESHLYSVNLKNMKMKKLTQSAGVHRVSMSSDGKYFIDRWSNLETPLSIDLIDYKGNNLRNLKTSTDPLESVKHGSTEIFSMESFDGEELWCRMIKPSYFDEAKEYPVIVYVYGGPHAQMVRSSFRGGAPLWMQAIAEEGYIIFTVDNRGSANRGKEFEQVIHRNLGSIEMQDQVYMTNWLKEQSYTDSSRFAVHGWSYGGFMTTSLMTRNAGVYEVGVAGGPVIDWSYYEIMYGERYMDTPEENPEGYEANNLKNHIAKLQGDLLIIHGTIDDVVLMQHSMSLLQKAVSEEIQLDFFAYPGHPHNVRGKDRAHLIRKVFDYIDLHLNN